MKNHFTAALRSCIVCYALLGTACCAENPRPNLMMWSPCTAHRYRAQATNHNPEIADALAQLRRLADESLSTPPLSVTHKTFIPPSGDPHDYSTIGRYWWPNPDTPDGLPWVRRDGETNPQYFDADFGDTQRFVDLWQSVTALSRAYWLTGHEPYGEKAAQLLRVWFINHDTRMNPHAHYAARFPGHWDGKSWGIHGTRQLAYIVEAVEMLDGCSAWANDDHAAMQQWVSNYLNWLLTSDNGIEEGDTINNHAVAYDWLVIRLAVFVGRTELATQVAESFKAKRIAIQIEPDGAMPAELNRAKPWRYTGYTLEYLFANAVLADRLGVDLWDYKTNDGRSIRGALDYLVKNIESDVNEPLNETVLNEVGITRLGPLLAVAGDIYADPTYTRLMERIGWNDPLSFVTNAPNRQMLNND